MHLYKFYFFLLFFTFLSCEKTTKSTFLEGDITKHYDDTKKPFYHGVASGDPLADRVIIWTRVTPEEEMISLPVKWIVAEDKEMTQVVQEGIAQASSERDFTIKLDVTGLKPNTYYYYKFVLKGRSSSIGRTKTAPARNVSNVKLAVISCTNYEAGYYNALAMLARKDSLDAIIHLGDYIYEYAPGGYGDESLDRHHIPNKEIISLSDYRTRYSLYRLDPDFQEVHKMHPFIVIWDDHEIANNAYNAGAKNHQEEDGDYVQRKQAAQQAYYEWLPIRENVGGQLYRKITMGKMADILLLDERLAGRTAPVDNVNNPSYLDETRSMLGEQQYQWLTKSLSSSEARWKIIGSQVVFSDFDQSAGRPERPFNMDAWDGYPAEKKKLIQFIQEHQLNNLIFVSGDTHCSWAFEVPSSAAAYEANPDAETIAIELGTPSITSSNYDEDESMATVLEIEKGYQKANPHLKYVNLHDHGYLLLDMNADQINATYHYVETIKERSMKERVGKVMRVGSEGDRFY